MPCAHSGGSMRKPTNAFSEDTPMNAKTLIIAPILLILAGGIYWFAHKDSARSQPTHANHSSDIPDTPADVMASTLPSEQTEIAHTIVDPKQFCNRQETCKDDPTVPNNPNELRWMQQHGYPTRDEQDRLMRLSETELELEAKQGKLTAMTELGSRMIDRNDPNGSLWLLRATEHGSIYAYYAISKKEMNRTLGHGLIESGAFLRVAYLLGDYKAGTALYQFASKEGLSIGEFNMIDRRAASLYITFANNRQPAPRPFE